MVYRRTIQDKGEDQLVIANADGSNEQVIFRHESGVKGFSTDPSWSASRRPHRGRCLGNWARISLHPFWCSRQRASWSRVFRCRCCFGIWRGCPILPDCFSSVPKNRLLRKQIWFQPYPEGQPFKISNDLSQYFSLSVTADGKSFVTIQNAHRQRRFTWAILPQS